MRRYVGYFAAVAGGLVLGYFAGREHLKFEIRSALSSVSGEFGRGFSSVLGADDSEPHKVSESLARPERDEEAANKTDYIANSLELYDVSAKYTNSYLSGRVPGVLFKIRNSGNRSLDKIEVTVYFKDAKGAVIAEESFHPILVTKYSLDDNRSLKPGYIWQMERGKFYEARSVPSEWKEGSIDAAITDIRFSESQ